MAIFSLRIHKTVPLDGQSVRIDRKGSWGNPFILAKESERAKVIDQHRRWLISRILSGDLPITELASLHDKDLYCWCTPRACHGETLAEFAEAAHKIVHEGMAPRLAPWAFAMAGSLQTRAGQWQRETFGVFQTNEGMLAHADKEILELRHAHSAENFREESADMLLLLLGLADRNGFDLLGGLESEDDTACCEPLTPEATNILLDHAQAALDGLKPESELPIFRVECSKILAVLLSLAGRAGFSLLAAAEEKLSINMTRKWGTPGPDGAIHHIKEPR